MRGVSNMLKMTSELYSSLYIRNVGDNAKMHVKIHVERFERISIFCKVCKEYCIEIANIAICTIP